MKLSLSWIFDHINSPLHTLDVHYIVEQCNEKITEIESYTRVAPEKDTLYFAQITAISATHVHMTIVDTAHTVTVELRENIAAGDYYLLYKKQDQYSWATMHHVGSIKESLLPSLAVTNPCALLYDALYQEDYVIEISNSAITHRADLWSHRGFAREIALALGLELRPLDSLLKPWHVQEISQPPFLSPSSFHFSAHIQTTACHRFASLYLPHVLSMPSVPWMAMRLARIDSKAIDALVDTGNYVMYDIGQPMHLFDAGLFSHRSITIRYAQNSEKLKTLDNQTIALTSHDLIVANGDHPVSLAGIMGGAETAVTSATQQLYIESALFDSAIIRSSAVQHKKRTDAATRFEKGIDSTLNTQAIKRFMCLLDAAHIAYTAENAIVSLGEQREHHVIVVAHHRIESVLGITLSSEFVIHVLTSLGFHLSVNAATMTYTITVPTWRMHKDMHMPEDIIEEVGRVYGYKKIPRIAPALPAVVRTHKEVTRARTIKQFLSFGVSMHELSSYAFFDEQWLAQLRWQPHAAVRVEYPVSRRWHQLVTTLIPHLLQAVHDNIHEHSSMQFFELARVWHDDTQLQQCVEQKRLTGITYDAQRSINFYDIQQYLQRLCSLLGLAVTWHEYSGDEPWYDRAATATIMYNDATLGTLGAIAPQWLTILGAKGNGYIFDLDADLLLATSATPIIMQPLSKFPRIRRDISMLVAPSILFAHLRTDIKCIDTRISDVQIIDSFTPKDAQGARALTVRYTIVDNSKTLTTPEIDKLHERITTMLTTQGITIR